MKITIDGTVWCDGSSETINDYSFARRLVLTPGEDFIQLDIRGELIRFERDEFLAAVEALKR